MSDLQYSIKGKRKIEVQSRCNKKIEFYTDFKLHNYAFNRLMVEQTPAEQKNVSPLMTIVCTRRGKYKLGRT